MEDTPNNNYKCILQKVSKMKISLITNIFAFSSKFPFRFLYLVSKSKKLNNIIEEILSYINMNNNDLNKQTLNFVNKYKLAQKIYLTIIEKTIEHKISDFKLDFPELGKISNIISEDNYKEVVYNNLKEELFENYNNLKIYFNDLKYKNINNKWFLKNISGKKNEFFNNCLFIINDLLSVQIIIYLLYCNNYLNFKNNLKVVKIKETDAMKLILGDEKIRYILEYPRAIILKEQFVSQLLKSNIDNFYICSFENKKRIYSIITQRKNNCNKINSINTGKNNKNMNITINKQKISMNEINIYLKEYESINAEILEFKNFTIENSIYDYFFSSYGSNKKDSIIINTNKSHNDNIIKSNIFKKINNDFLELNFEMDFFEINIDNKVISLHCSELISFINKANNIINLFLYNFPLLYLKQIKNPLIEFISIENFFNFDNDIHFYSKQINQNLPKLKKIRIIFSNYFESKEIIFIKRNNVILEDVKINLKNSVLKINEIINMINLNKIYSYIESFIGVKEILIGKDIIQLCNEAGKDTLFNFILKDNNSYGSKDYIIKEVDINILKYLNFDNLLIYGHILNGIKPVEYYVIDKKDNNKFFLKDFDIDEDMNMLNIINKNINNFSESNFSVIFKRDFFYLPFVENLLLKIHSKKLQKLLLNCVYGQEVTLYNINIDFLSNLKNINIKKINIYSLDDKDAFNNIEFNFRYIYYNIPSLNSISINLSNITSINFNKGVLPLVCFKIKYKNNNNSIFSNQNILVLDFGDNNEILSKIERKNLINICSKNDVILKFNEKEILLSKNESKFNFLKIKTSILNIFICLYIITIFIIIYIIFISILF